MDTFNLTTTAQQLYAANQGRQSLTLQNLGVFDALIATDGNTPTATSGFLCKANGGYLTIISGSASTAISAIASSGTTILIGTQNTVATPSNPSVLIGGPLAGGGAAGAVGMVSANGSNQNVATSFGLLTGSIPFLLNSDGVTVSPLLSYFGALKDRNAILEGLISQLIVTERGVLMALMSMAMLDNPNWKLNDIDDFNVEDILRKAAKGAPSDPNTLQ